MVQEDFSARLRFDPTGSDCNKLEEIFQEKSQCFIRYNLAVQNMLDDIPNFRRKFKNGFDGWQKCLLSIYDQAYLSRNLYIKHGFLVLVSREIYRTKFQEDNFNFKVKSVNIFLSNFAWLDFLDQIAECIDLLLENIDLPDHDLFNSIYPSMLPHLTKHGSGEYYTPISLAREMVHHAFIPGMRALDPSCGSGTFLCEMVKNTCKSNLSAKEKNIALENLVGIDKNTLAVFMAMINMKHLLWSYESVTGRPRFLVVDSLFDEDAALPPCSELDLVIGNPPWIVLGGVEDGKYKGKLKKLSKELDIYVGGKNASNLEVAILFLFKFRDNLKVGGHVFFILPYSIITGSQHGKARLFQGFHDVQVWKFSSQPFRIHSICLNVRKAVKRNVFSFKIPFQEVFHEKEEGRFRLLDQDPELFEPYDVIHDSNANIPMLARRFISSEKKRTLLPIGDSSYKDLFYKGAQVFPRRMLFVEILDEGEIDDARLITISPSDDVVAKKRGRWAFLPYSRAKIEPEYVFKIAKSTFLVPFIVLKYLNAFLPFEKKTSNGKPSLVPARDVLPHAKKHFQHLERIYDQHKKPGASHDSLKEIVNYQGCLENPRQMEPIKVVYNGGGSIVKGAIVPGEIIIDYSLFYYPATSMDEAYYLLAYLNAPCLTESVKLVGSTGYHGSLRNVVKHPLDFPWPIFDRQNAAHVELSKQGALLAKEAKQLVNEQTNNEMDCVGPGKEMSRISIQNMLFGSLEGKIKRMNQLVLSILDDHS